MKYSWSQKVSEIIDDDDTLMQRVIEKGSKEVISIREEETKVAQYVLFINEMYVLVWEN